MARFKIYWDFSQTVSSEEIKNANVSIRTAGDDTEEGERHRNDFPAGMEQTSLI